MAVIVVADDEFLLAQMLADLLEDEGHSVLTAQDGRRALDLLRTSDAKLLITDFMMPRMNGLELAQEIRADEVLSDLPILLVSGAQSKIARQHTDLFNEVLDKPYSHRRVVELVAEMIGRR